MKKILITFAAICAVSNSAIASDTVIPVKASAETAIKIKIKNQGISTDVSASSQFQGCNPWAQNPWDIRC